PGAPREVPEAPRHVLEGGEALLEEQAERRREGRRRSAGRGQGDRRHLLGDQEVRPATALFRVAVAGRSMEPTFRDGDWLLVRRLDRLPRAGDVVVAEDPREPDRLIVKRVRDVAPAGVTVQGDNPDPEGSTDSR